MAKLAERRQGPAEENTRREPSTGLQRRVRLVEKESGVAQADLRSMWCFTSEAHESRRQVFGHVTPREDLSASRLGSLRPVLSRPLNPPPGALPPGSQATKAAGRASRATVGAERQQPQRRI
jgi:hypothetical protein